MKTASSALINFLEDTLEYVHMDLYTFQLNGGAVLAYAGGNLPLAYSNGVASYFNLGPPIQDAGVQCSRGLNGVTVDVTIYGGDGRFTVGGQDILDFIENFGLDGASARIDRVYCDTWSNMFSTGPIGGYQRFGGFVGEVKEHGQTQSVIALNSWLDVLQVPYPAEVYQTGCLNSFGDSDCGVNVPALTNTGAAGNGTLTQIAFGSGLTAATGYYNLGVVTFTSGANAGIARSIKSYSNSYGLVTLTSPLPAAPSAGDAFTISPGCALTLAACQGWDSVSPAPAHPYLQRFRGFPFTPPPTTGLPI
jgi:uncharacterized phage protein (TIGR02218 family)